MIRRASKLSLLLILVALLAIGVHITRVLTDPLIAAGETWQFMIEKGDNFQQIFTRMTEPGGTDNYNYMYTWLAAKFLQADRQIKAGEYRLVGPLGTLDILTTLINGRGILHSQALFEGWTIQEMLNAMAYNPAIRTTEEPLHHFGYQSVQDAEGRCLPDTYKHYRGDTDTQILSLCLRAMDELLDELWANRAEGLPYETPREGLILASIVEAETNQDDERAVIAGVLLKRMKKKMRLQVDPAVIYGLGPDFDNNLKRKHLRESPKTNPYNTYRIHGLPPGPIGNPGRKSLEAAFHPDMTTEALYYVSIGNGKHRFSSTYKEHREYVRKYQQGK